MTIRPRAVRALRDARTRLRDAAAASHAQAAAVREGAHLQLVREHEALEQYLDDAAGELSAARTVHDLDRVAESTGVYRLVIADAAARHDEAHAAAELAADKLRDRARALRRAEKLEEHVAEHRARSEAKAEQRATDDLISARRK